MKKPEKVIKHRTDEGKRIIKLERSEKESSNVIKLINRNEQRVQCNVTQQPCKSPKGPPHKSRTVKGETADCIGSSLTLPRSYLATCNRSASKLW